MQQGLERRIVAVMFSDMVGYTTLIGSDERVAIRKRDQYVSTLERAHAAFGGTIVQRLGDGSMSMFPSSLAAARAAISMQGELAAADVPVRIGIHVGEVVVEPERLTGEAVNVCSRIESFAVPGAVLLSDSARDQIANQVDLDTVSLGRFRLKNVGRAVELFAIAAEGVVVPDRHALEGKGERLASLSSQMDELTSPLVGRSADIDAIVALVREHRIVTITGVGGVGKTSLVAAVGRALAGEFVDGVAFVGLADTKEPEDFFQTLAVALDVKETEERTVRDGVAALIGERQALLLLDNMEQIVEAGTDVAWLAAACPRLHIAVTSRTPLRVAAEREFQLGTLALPAELSDGDLEALRESPAVAMFVERAKASKSDFAVTPENAPAVVAICRRLDGLPLALELAAARLRIMSPQSLLDRLDGALNVLTSTRRAVHERQQTLRATIDWSYSLLTHEEQRIFGRMAIFTGGCRIDDIEAVCADGDESVLDAVESLLDKALVQVDGQTDRLRMLQTIHDYADERLRDSAESKAIALRHARRYAQTAAYIRDGIESTYEIEALERGIADEGNMLAALDTLLAQASEGQDEARELGMQMTGDLYFYWHIRGKNVTALDYASGFLELDAGRSRTEGRAGALITAGLGSWVLGEFQEAADQWHEAYSIATDCNAPRARCRAAFFQALALLGIDTDAAARWTEEGADLGAAMGWPWAVALASTFEGIVHAVSGDPERAQVRYSDALAIQQELGDYEGAGVSLGGLAALAAGRDDYASGLDLYQQALAAFETCGDRAEEARILAEMAWTYLRHGEAANARDRFLDSVRVYTGVGSVRGIGLSLVGLAAAEVIEDRPERAVQIAAAAEVYAGQEGIVNVYSDDTPGRDYVDRARATLTAERTAQATELGRRLTIKQAVELAQLGGVDAPI